MAVKAVPEGFGTVTPFIMVRGVKQLLEYLGSAFQAKTLSAAPAPDGTVMHAEIEIGDSKLMLGESSDKWPAMPGSFYVYVEDCDAVYKRAVDAGGISKREPTDEFYGDRSCGVEDPSGNQWWIATHIEDVSPEEMERRQKEFAAKTAEATT